jgi:thiol-disulfide isomerase/thioredoxin
MDRDLAAQSMTNAYVRGWTDLESLFSDVSVSPPPAHRFTAPRETTGGCSWFLVGALALLGLVFLFAVTPTKFQAGCDCAQPKLKKMRVITNPSDVVPTQGPAVVFYHASWCGHCERFKPTFEALAAEHGKDIDFATVEDEVLRASPLGEALAVAAYPTVVFFQNGVQMRRSEGANEAALQELVAAAKQQ